MRGRGRCDLDRHLGMNHPVTRAEPVGSLLRPSGLLQARLEHEAGRLAAPESKRAEDAAVDHAIAVQEAAGLDVVTDGEQRRAHFTGPLSEAVEGLREIPADRIEWNGTVPADEMTYAHRRAVTGKLRRVRSLAQEEFVYLRARARAGHRSSRPPPASRVRLRGPWPSRARTPRRK